METNFNHQPLDELLQEFQGITPIQQNPIMSREDSIILPIYPTEPYVCTECGSSIDIHSITPVQREYKISYKCQNNHEVKMRSLLDFINNQPQETKEITTCSKHNGEKYLAYCKKCQTSLCLECFMDDIHRDEENCIINYTQLLPGKQVMKELIKKRNQDIEKIEKERARVLCWVEKIKEEINKLLDNQLALAEFQKYYLQNFMCSQFNYAKGKSINYLLNDVKFIPNFPTLEEKKFEKTFRTIENNIYEQIKLGVEEEKEDIEKENSDDLKSTNLRASKLKYSSISVNEKNKTPTTISVNDKNKTPLTISMNEKMKTPLTISISEKNKTPNTVSMNEKNKTPASSFRVLKKVEVEEVDPLNGIDFNKLKSNILKNEKDLITIMDFFEDKPTALKKLYTASEYDGSAKSFHLKCDKKGATLTIIKSDTNNVFGGFTLKNFGSVRGHVNDPDSFVFSLSKNKMFEASTGSGISSINTCGPVFDGDKGNVIRIEANCLNEKTSTTSYSGKFSDAILQSEMKKGDSVKFKVIDYEVYQVIF